MRAGRESSDWCGKTRPCRRLMMRAAMLLLACASLPVQSSPPMQFTRLTAEDGLSQGAVMAMLEDSQGFLWLGTEDGLDRYDGYEIQRYVHDRAQSSSLPDNWVSTLAQDRMGTLWIGTAGGGVVGRNPNTGALVRLGAAAGEFAVAANERVRLLFIDRDGRLCIATRDHGLVIVDRAQGASRRFRSDANDLTTLSSDSVLAITQDAKGNIWLGTQAGLDRLDLATNRVERQPLRQWLPAGAPSDLEVTALLTDNRGELWVGTNDGLVRISSAGHVTVYSSRAGDPHALPSERVQALLMDRSQRLWIGTAKGLALYQGQGNDFATYRHDPADPGSLPDDSVISLYEDSSGLWVGTKTGGAAHWNSRSWSFGHHPREAAGQFGDANPSAFATDADGTLWIATFGGGLSAINTRAGSVAHYRHRDGDSASLPDDRVMSLLVDHDNMVWAGTMSGGLARLDRSTGRFHVYNYDPGDPTSLPASGVMSLLEDSRGRLWVGTFGGGLARFDRPTERFTRYASDPGDPSTLSSGRATALAEDKTGLIWVGTDGGGLCLLNPSNGRVIRFGHDAQGTRGLSADTVYAIRVDGRGQVWVGTRGAGLDEVSGSALTPERIRFRNYSEAQGLPNSTIYGIEVGAGGRLWLSTNRGLARFDPVTGEVRNFGRLHGLQADEFNFGAHYRSREGELFFGGPGGYNAFFPDRLEFNGRPPPVVLTAFLKFNEPARLGLVPERISHLDLSYRDSVVTFEFAALDFTSPAHNHYRYKLEGFDKDWVDAGSKRSVTYTNLGGGQYTFQVRAANSDGIWNDAGLAIPVTVEPPLWATSWARIAYVFALGMLISAVWHNQHKKLRREALYAQRLQREVEERTTELARRNDDLKRANQRLREASVTDPLTGLGNRRYLYEAVAPLVTPATEPAAVPTTAVLFVIDLDHLKPINDLHGHEAGDQVLIAVADILRRSCRASDILVRWGGDEFVIVYLDADMNAAEQLAERIRSSVAKRVFHCSDGRSVRTSCSIGFARFPFIHEAPNRVSWEQLLAVADAALYHAKKERNGWIGWAGTAAAAGQAEMIAMLERNAESLECRGLLDVRRPRFRPEDTVNTLYLQPRRRSDP
jgi:diguanylate cyclase (GGDEF)-like protein